MGDLRAVRKVPSIGDELLRNIHDHPPIFKTAPPTLTKIIFPASPSKNKIFPGPPPRKKKLIPRPPTQI